MQLALEGGAASITVSAVAHRAGLSRSSFYEYFSSSADLIADLVLEEFNIYRERLATAVASAENPNQHIELWIDEALRYVVDGRHLLVKSLNSISLPDFRKQEIALGHRGLMATIVDELHEIGVQDIQAALTYVQNSLDTAATRIEAGNNAEQEIKIAQRYVAAGLSALADLPLSNG
jgi:AcrR family transcriptional regulator